MTKLSLNINVRTTKQRLWEIITHPEKYSSFIPNIKDVTVLQRDQLVSLVRWKINVEGVEFQWTEQCHYDKQAARIAFHSTRGDFSSYDGTLCIEHAPKGVNLILDANIDWDIPSFEKVVGKIIEEKVRRSFTGMLIAIKRYAERERVSQSYAFVIHPIDLGLFSVTFREPNIVSKRRDLVSKLFEWLPPFKCSDIVGLEGLEGRKVDGALIYCPLLPDQMMSEGGEMAFKRTVEAVRVAEGLGAKVVGLGAYAAQVGRKGILVAEAVKVPITTGTSYTIGIAVNAVESACQTVGAKLDQMTVGIIGATGGIGSACTELLAGRVAGLVISARNKTRLDALEQRIKEKVPALKVTQTTELDWVLANSDILLTATNTPAALIDARSLRPGTIVCDVSRPRNVSVESVEETNGSVLVFDGGIVKPPGEVDFDFYFGLPPGLAYACMAETMILALAERFEGYSIGGNITSSKIEEISRLGKEFGFRLAELRWNEKEVPPRIFDSVREHIQKRKTGIWV